MAKKTPEKQKNTWVVPVIIIAAIVVMLVMFSGCVALLSSDFETGNVAVIPIHGAITIGTDSFFADEGTSSSTIVRWIEEASADPYIEAIVLDVNSGGGAPVASAEIARAIADTDKLVIAQIREVGASGAYWVASAADKIYANELSITGSIGVIGSYLEVYGLLNDYNVTYNRQVAGDLKDSGSPFREMTSEERDLYQQTLDKMHDVFIREVAKNRNVDETVIRELATGQVYLGLDAVENGLVDELGSRPDVTMYLEEELDITVEYLRYKEDITFIDALTGFQHDFGKNVGLGIGTRVIQHQEEKLVRGSSGVWI